MYVCMHICVWVCVGIYVHIYRIAGYIGRNVWQIARKRKKIAIGGYKIGGYNTIAMPPPGVYAVGAILVDLILEVPICQI